MSRFIHWLRYVQGDSFRSALSTLEPMTDPVSEEFHGLCNFDQLLNDSKPTRNTKLPEPCRPLGRCIYLPASIELSTLQPTPS